jgi:hypothetical protein
MRLKLSALGLLLVSIGTTCGCTSADANYLKGAIVPAVTSFQVSSPAAENFGIHPYGQVIQIPNATGLEGELVVFGRTVAKVFPNETLVVRRFYEPLGNSQLPIAVIFRKNGLYAGCATNLIYMGANAPPVIWTIRGYDVVRFGERNEESAKESGSRRKFSVRAIDLPQELVNGTSWFQIVNDTPYFAEVVANGAHRARIAPGEVYALRASTFPFGSAYAVPQIPVSLLFFDENGRAMGSVEQYLQAQVSGAYAAQYVASPFSLR